MTACDLEKSFAFDNKASLESFGKSRVATFTAENGLALCMC